MIETTKPPLDTSFAGIIVRDSILHIFTSSAEFIEAKDRLGMRSHYSTWIDGTVFHGDVPTPKTSIHIENTGGENE